MHQICPFSSVSKGGLELESAGGFSIAIINIPFYYPKLNDICTVVYESMFVRTYFGTIKLFYFRLQKNRSI